MESDRLSNSSPIERAIDNAGSFLQLRDVALLIDGIEDPAEARRLRERVLELAFARFSVTCQGSAVPHG